MASVKWMNVSEYARHRRARGLMGGSRSAVYKAIASERIQIKYGIIDQAQADLDWANNTCPRIDFLEGTFRGKR